MAKQNNNNNPGKTESFFASHYLAMTIGDVEIDLSRAKDPDDSTKVNEVVVVQPAPNETLVLNQSKVKDLSTDLWKLFPAGISITVKDLSFGMVDKPLKKTSGSQSRSGSAPVYGKVLAANFGLNIDFSDLPLVGHMLPPNLKLSVEDVQILMSNEAITDTTNITNRLPQDITAYPTSITKGVNFMAKVHAGGDTITISSGTMQKLHTATNGQPNPANTASGGKQSQGNINKQFGPVFIQSVGINFQNGDLNFVITGSIKLGPLTVTLDQLQVGSPLNEFSPEASLHGLSVDYKKNQVNIGGGLVREEVNGLEMYNGALAVDLTKFQLSALGSYTNDHGNPSLFVFAQLNEPLGGPAFFFVTGLAFTFGINRNLIKPQVQDVSTFPLIKAASGSIAPPKAGATSLIPAGMNTYLPPQIGEDFVGIGVKFTSFKVINSFALFIVKFGKELEFDLLGLSSYIAPNPKDPKPVATVELEIVGSYKPATGTLLIRGMLTPSSFVLSRNCHLQGAFAIAVWTGSNPHSGEFVFTFGGYGSHYTPQPYYPQGIAELGFTWQIDPEISIKGGGYWALTPHRILAGGFLKAVCNLGFVRASFNMNAYFEIDWSPLHYQGHFSVEFNLEVKIDLLFTSFWLGFTVGEGLSIHGPEFGGEAFISLYVCTVHIAFGSTPEPKPLLDYSSFRTTYTPYKEIAAKGSVLAYNTGMVKINLTRGLVKTVKNEAGQEVEVINPKDLCLTANTFIPNSTYQLGTNAPKAGLAFGIKPMGVDCPELTINGSTIDTPALGDYETNLTVTVYTTGDASASEVSQFKIVKNQENVPKAIWGPPPPPGQQPTADEPTVIPAIMGVEILPATPPKAGETAAVLRSILAWEDELRANSFAWSDPGTFSGTENDSTASTYKSTNESTLSGATTDQSSVLAALGFGTGDIPSDSGLKTRLDNMDSILIGTLS